MAVHLHVHLSGHPGRWGSARETLRLLDRWSPLPGRTPTAAVGASVARQRGRDPPACEAREPCILNLVITRIAVFPILADPD